MKIISFILFFFLITTTRCFSQDIKNEEQIFRYAIKLQDDKKWNDALTIFKNLLKKDSSNVEYLWRTSYIYSVQGYAQSTEQIRQQWYMTAAYLGHKAITQHPQNAWAHYAYAVAIGRMSERAGNKTKIHNARLIKSEAETAIKLNPRLAGPYHILGRWHRVVAGFNGFERSMIKAVFGGMPGGTYDDSILNFEKAILLEPTNYTHYIEVANTYLERNKVNDKQHAKNWLTKAMSIPVKSDDDEHNRAKCKEILLKIK